MIIYVHVLNNKVQTLIKDYLIEGDEIVNQHSVKNRYPLSECKAVEILEDQEEFAGRKNAYSIDQNGNVSLISRATFDAYILNNKKQKAKKEAYSLADKIKAEFIIQHTSGKVYEFPKNELLRFFQKYTEQGDLDKIRVRVKNAKSAQLNRANATLLKTAIEAHENSVEDALEVDLDAITVGDLSLSNLTAIKTSQESLR